MFVCLFPQYAVRQRICHRFREDIAKQMQPPIADVSDRKYRKRSGWIFLLPLRFLCISLFLRSYSKRSKDTPTLKNDRLLYFFRRYPASAKFSHTLCMIAAT